MAMLPKGANAPLNGTSVDVVLEWTESSGVTHDVDLCGLILGSDGRVRDDSDFVFYNQPVHPSGAVTHKGRVGASERLAVNVEQLPDDVEKVVLVGSISDGNFGAVTGLAIALIDSSGSNDELRFDSMGAANETASVVGELYKRNGQWQFRAVGQGWETGLAGLATNYGVRIAAPAALELETVPEPAAEALRSGPAATPAESDAAPSRDQVPAGGSGKPSSTEQPAVGTRERIPHASVAAGTPNLDGDALTLAIGQPVVLVQRGATPQNLWLRVTHTNADSTAATDLSVISYDEYGVPSNVVYFGNVNGAGETIRLVNKPTSATRDDTAAVELKLATIDGAISGLVIAATSYEGKALASCGALVTELVASDGSVLTRTECPAPNDIGVLLASLKRDASGAWVWTPLSSPAPGRTAKSVVGAGRWALSA